MLERLVNKRAIVGYVKNVIYGTFRESTPDCRVRKHLFMERLVSQRRAVVSVFYLAWNV